MIGIFSDDSFIVVWSNQKEIFIQMFYANGTKKGSEFIVNSYTNNVQSYPEIETSKNDSMIVWISDK